MSGFIIPDERVNQNRCMNAHSASTPEKQIIINNETIEQLEHA
jgi:hypothetical protein